MIKMTQIVHTSITPSDLKEGQTMVCTDPEEWNGQILIRPFESKDVVKVDKPIDTYDVTKTLKDVKGYLLNSGSFVSYIVE